MLPHNTVKYRPLRDIVLGPPATKHLVVDNYWENLKIHSFNHSSYWHRTFRIYFAKRTLQEAFELGLILIQSIHFSHLRRLRSSVNKAFQNWPIRGYTRSLHTRTTFRYKVCPQAFVRISHLSLFISLPPFFALHTALRTEVQIDARAFVIHEKILSNCNFEGIFKYHCLCKSLITLAFVWVLILIRH